MQSRNRAGGRQGTIVVGIITTGGITTGLRGVGGSFGDGGEVLVTAVVGAGR